jgi:hypothetical protein
MTDSPPKLHGVCDLREFFRTNQTPVYFVSPKAGGRLQADDNRLEDRCRSWIAGIRAEFAGTPLAAEQPAPVTPTSFKMA